MAIRNLTSKKLKECYENELFLNLENMEVYCNFPYPDEGVTFKTRILEIVMDGDKVNPDDVLNDDDLENILSQVKTVIVTESEKKRNSRKGNVKSFREFLSESDKGDKHVTISDILKSSTNKVLKN